MAVYNKINDFVEQLVKGVHKAHAAGDTFKAMLTNSAPVATNTVKADLTEISAGNGYTAGGADIQNDESRSGGTVTVNAVAYTWTASGGTIGPFRYVAIYNDTPTSPADPLICWFDYGSSLTLQIGDQFTINFSTGLFTLA